MLGEGGFGFVYAAEAKADARRVAVKVARLEEPIAAPRLLQEAEALRAVGPPYVPEVFATGALDSGAPYVVMEFLQTGTLADRLADRREPLKVKEEFQPLAEVLTKALAAIHAKGLIHRDLKPENIFVFDNPIGVKIVDFGLVKQMGSASTTQTGTAMGTSDYMSPEQCRAERNVDHRADIYSLGVLFYEMLAGRTPFLGTPADVHQAHISRRPPRLSSFVAVPSGVEEVIMCCLAKDSEQRPQSAEALHHMLGEALARTDSAPSKAAIPSAKATQPGRPGREKRTVGLLFLESEEDTSQMRALLQAFGGELGHASGTQCVGIFSHEVGDNPLRRMLAAARGVLQSGVCAKLLLHVAAVTIIAQPDGTRRYMSPLFAKRDRYPQAADPAGILMSQEVQDVIGEAAVPAGRAGVLHVGATPVSKTTDFSSAVWSSKSPFVGRDDVLDELVSSATEAFGNRTPAIATVLAAAGQGKSRLGAALLDKLRQTFPSVLIVELRAREPASGDPDQTIRELLRTVLNLPLERPADGGQCLVVDRLGEALGKEVWAGVALTMGWVTREAPEVRGLAVAPGALRQAAARAAGTALRQIGAGPDARPLAILFDDAQFSDDAALDALEYATVAELSAPVWLCVLARPEFEAGRPEWAKRAAKRLDRKLGPLDEASAAELCRRLLRPAENVPSSAVARLVERTQGIPLLLVELVRGLKAQGLVRQQQGKGGGWYLATDELDKMPDMPLVEWLASRELDSLPPELAAHERLVALLGLEFTLREVQGVLEELDRDGLASSFPLDANVGTKRLLASGVLVSHRHGRVGFRHALMREAVARSVPDALRRQVHAAAYRYFGNHSALTENERLVRVALHASQCGLTAEAAEAYFKLARSALGRHSYLESEVFYTGVLQYLDPKDARGRLEAHQGRGMMRYRLCRYEDSVGDFATARELANEIGDRQAEIDVHLQEAMALDWSDDYHRSREVAGRAESLYQELGERVPLLEAHLVMALGRSCFRFNQEVRAAELLEDAGRLAKGLGDSAYEIYVVALLVNGYIYANLGRLEDSRRCFDELIPLLKEKGDKLHYAAVLNNRTMLWTCLGERERLEDDMRELLELSRDMGNARLEQQAHLYLALFFYWAGDLAEAEPHARKALDIDERRFGDTARPETALLLARVLLAKGDAETAQVLEKIRQRQAERRSRGDKEAELLPTEEVFFQMVDLSLRQASSEDWHRVAEMASSVLTVQEQIELWERRGLVGLARSEPHDARESLTRALELAGRVPNMMRERIELELRRATAV